jgi:hypothetical protein
LIVACLFSDSLTRRGRYSPFFVQHIFMQRGAKPEGAAPFLISAKNDAL